MASGYYPLSRASVSGKRIAEIVDELRGLIENRGPWNREGLPAAWENESTDNAAFDGQYEAFLYLAVELLERCVERRALSKATLAQEGEQ